MSDADLELEGAVAASLQQFLNRTGKGDKLRSTGKGDRLRSCILISLYLSRIRIRIRRVMHPKLQLFLRVEGHRHGSWGAVLMVLFVEAVKWAKRRFAKPSAWPPCSIITPLLLVFASLFVF